MIPYILAAVGGYLIGDSLNAKLFAGGGKVDMPSIDEVREEGEFIDSYMIDESQTVSNAGEQESYIYKGRNYLITTWNERAENHKNGEEEIAVSELFEDGGNMAKGGNVRSLFNKFHEEKPLILLIMIADEVSEDFMRKKFDSTIEWDKLSNEEKEKYNSDYRKNKKEFEKYLMYEFVRLYYSDKKVKEKCKGSSKSTISAIKSVMTDLAKKYPENKYADGGMMAKGGKVKWIQDALDGNTKGALRATAKRKGLLRGDENLSKTDLKKLQKMGGKTAKRAHLAETLSKF